MAVILAGGRGTRLQPYTITIPKPLLPVGDVPILEVVLRQLAADGFERVVIALGHMAHLLAATIGDGSRFGLRIQYCPEEQPLGTAGALRLIEDPEDNVLVMNGDVLTTLDYRALFQHHRASGAAATIATHKREVKIDYGVIQASADGTFSRYEEKPTIRYEVSMGINVLSRSAFAVIPASRKYDMPDLIQALHDAGNRISCFPTACYWQDIGRFDDYQQASADFARDPDRFLAPDRLRE
jgi:NDP-sugar pyrophosphorylase family protein